MNNGVRKRLKVTTACSIAAAALLAAPAAAQDHQDLERRLAEMEKMVAALKAELEEQRAEREDATVDRLEVRAMATEAMERGNARDEEQGFRMGDTSVTIGGFADFAAHLTNFSDGSVSGGSIARDFYIPGATPIGGDGTTVTDFTAEASRLFVRGSRDVNGRTFSGYLEVDFLGSLQGNQRVSNSFAPRLRNVYLDTGNVRAGQDWTTFQNTSAIPESASFLVLSDGMSFIRQPLVRYSSGNFQVALENADLTVTLPDGTRMEADSASIPDVVARYNMKGDYGNISIMGLARNLRADMAGVDDETFGYGASISGRLKVGEKDDLRFNLVGGEGVGRYVGLNAVNGAALDPATGELEAIPSYGGLLAYRHPFGKTARLNFGVSGLWADNPDFASGLATKSVQSAYGAILWDIAPRTSVGAEILVGQRENEAGDTGDISRVTVATRYKF